MDHGKEKEARPPSFARKFTSRERERERERETSGGKARGLVMLHAKVGTRLVVPFKGIQLCSACECLLNPIN